MLPCLVGQTSQVLCSGAVAAVDNRCLLPEQHLLASVMLCGEIAERLCCFLGQARNTEDNKFVFQCQMVTNFK